MNGCQVQGFAPFRSESGTAVRWNSDGSVFHERKQKGEKDRNSVNEWLIKEAATGQTTSETIKAVSKEKSADQRTRNCCLKVHF
jgi:hypothetical protein